MPDLFKAISSDRWQIALVAVAFTALALLYVASSPNVYRAEALIQLDTKSEKQPAREGSFAQTAAEFETQPTTVAELSIITSRTVLGEVVDTLSLAIDAHPRQLPYIGALAAKLSALGSTPPPRIELQTFDLPKHLHDKPFTLVATGKKGGYTLLDGKGGTLAKGAVGERLEVEIDNEPLTLLVTRLEAAEDTDFVLMRKSRGRAIDELQRQLVTAEEGKESGLIRISIEGPDRDHIARVVAAVADAYIARQREWRSGAVQETLAFLKDQIPKLAAGASEAEERLGAFRRENGAINLASETERLLDRAVTIQVQINDKLRLQDTYLPTHPSAVAIGSEITALKGDLERINSRLNNLPRLQQRYVDLSRNADISAALYSSVKQHMQELQLIKSAASHEIRLIDPGEATFDPVRPRRALIYTAAVVMGLFVGAIVALGRRLYRGPLTGPSAVEELLGIPVYTSLPLALHQRPLPAPQKQIGGPPILTHPDSAYPAILGFRVPLTRLFGRADVFEIAAEGFRSLRTWINTSSFKRTNNVLLITGATQGVGKTFVSVNLAVTLALAGRRVLLIDCDLRKGNIHRYFNTAATPGLSDLITGNGKDLSKAVHEVGKSIHLIPTGTPRLCDPELLIHERFAQMVALASQCYDEVIVDSPPILAVSDASVIGQLAGSTLLVVREEINTAAELMEAAKRLDHAGVPLRGVVYNGSKESLSYYYGSHEQLRAVGS